METIKNNITSIDDINMILPQFGVKTLREAQKEVVSALLFEERDLLSILPTGGGKTLCFCLASYFQSGLTIIVYPLLSLMRDQKKRFDASPIKAEILQGGQTKNERKCIFSSIRNKDVKVIITNPETLNSKKVLEFLNEEEISLFVLDEAHTVVEWGETFRSAYIELKAVIEKIKPEKIAAFTATSSIYVTDKLNEYIFFKSPPRVIRLSSNRENINYHRVLTLSRRESLIEILNICKYPVLIFTSTRKEATNTAKFLSDFQNHPVKFYHAGLTKNEKLDIEKWYYNSDDGILSSTCAFGMGVDKGNIRSVIHIKPPCSPSAFLQESGRAGRDGETADSYIIVKKSDLYEKNGKINKCSEIFLNEKKDIRKSLLEEMGEDTTSFKENPNDIPFITSAFSKKKIVEEVALNRGFYTKGSLSYRLRNKMPFSKSECNFTSKSEKFTKEAITSLIDDNTFATIGEYLYPYKLTHYEKTLKRIANLKEKGKCYFKHFLAKLKDKCTRLTAELKIR